MPDQEQNPFDEFPAEVRRSVEGLMWLGHLEQPVSFAGHKFTIRTLKISEELEAGLIAKEYLDSFGQVKANATAQLAAAIQSVDGDPDFCPPIGPDAGAHIRAKFQYISSNWYWSTIQYLFNEYTQLVSRSVNAVVALEDLSNRSLGSFWPSPDSLTERGDLEANSTAPNSPASNTSS